MAACRTQGWSPQRHILVQCAKKAKALCRLLSTRSQLEELEINRGRAALIVFFKIPRTAALDREIMIKLMLFGMCSGKLGLMTLLLMMTKEERIFF
ncbi:hypothetical protein NDU88_002881 [Pleurodeles waltl]|uniref:Uncharacterized protein n=1 Tax=Pleurodeles waltl TaxID=8319 RepID=A0AAV7VFM1_PLEWA|nr:hypothetical protein NDU88_002881 [Pleurodeles waltl]